ncbi:hypothetical protein HT031_000766 [Scenedesmus sp. PABB004]|nr:hypothetical protein HT031_000766 [Scenedesmus sp. PABB004]
MRLAAAPPRALREPTGRRRAPADPQQPRPRRRAGRPAAAAGAGPAAAAAAQPAQPPAAQTHQQQHQQPQQQQHQQQQQQQQPQRQPFEGDAPQQPRGSWDTVNAGQAFEEDAYEASAQAAARNSWATRVRSATGRRNQAVWSPQLDPPPLLGCVTVVLVGPKKPVSCGTAARACSCFEVADLRVVAPRCDHTNRSARSVSKGAQYVLHGAQRHATLAGALVGADLSVAFTRWLPGRRQPSLPDVPSLLAHPDVRRALTQPLAPAAAAAAAAPAGGRTAAGGGSDGGGGGGGPRVALVFGREEYGLSDAEVAACDVACAISIGRLQESLSLSHSVSIVLAQLYQARLSALADAAGGAPPFAVGSADELADGVDTCAGVEH